METINKAQRGPSSTATAARNANSNILDDYVSQVDLRNLSPAHIRGLFAIKAQDIIDCDSLS